MKRIVYIVLALCSISLVPLQAQDKYSDILERTRSLSPYEAAYLLMNSLSTDPENASIDYHLGNIFYDLLPTRDPLHRYTELSTLLYQSRLFYGNCLHFAKDKKLPGWQYEPLANGQKRIEYAALEQYIRPRLAEIKRRQTACDSIHHTFVRMAERYNRCQALFTDFLNRYTREKTAHIRLQPAERDLLQALRLAADSLDADIADYRRALALQPIDGYTPAFRKEPIVLYRLDGLTHTDFLQNDIATWDYSQWVTNFLNQQQEVYQRLYADLVREEQQLRQQCAQYDAGQTISGQIDASLIGRCDRLELQNEQVENIRLMQQKVLNAVAQLTIAQSAAPQTVRELVPLLQIAAARRDAVQDKAWLEINSRLIELSQPLRTQMQATYTHPVSGEKINYTPAEGSKVFALLPDDTGYRCVTTDADGAVCVLTLNADRSVSRQLLRQPDEQPLVFTRIPGRLWVLITTQHIYWLE